MRAEKLLTEPPALLLKKKRRATEKIIFGTAGYNQETAELTECIIFITFYEFYFGFGTLKEIWA